MHQSVDTGEFDPAHWVFQVSFQRLHRDFVDRQRSVLPPHVIYDDRYIQIRPRVEHRKDLIKTTVNQNVPIQCLHTHRGLSQSSEVALARQVPHEVETNAAHAPLVETMQFGVRGGIVDERNAAIPPPVMAIPSSKAL
nr:hypothetical protein [Pandoraea sp. XY-2]